MRTKSLTSTQTMYLVSGSFAALTMANPTLVAAMVQDMPGAQEGAPATQSAMPMSEEQKADFDLWPADRQSAYQGWPDETKSYYWTLNAERQDLFWRLTDENKVSLTAMNEEDRTSAWQMIEARANAVAGDEPAPPPPPPDEG